MEFSGEGKMGKKGSAALNIKGSRKKSEG